MKQELRVKYENMLKEAKNPKSGCSPAYIKRLEDILSGEKFMFGHDRYPSHFLFECEEKDETKEKQEENLQRLQGCEGHQFSETADTIEGFFFSVYSKCVHCGGVVTETEKNWYEKGVEHAKQAFPKIEYMYVQYKTEKGKIRFYKDAEDEGVFVGTMNNLLPVYQHYGNKGWEFVNWTEGKMLFKQVT